MNAAIRDNVLDARQLRETIRVLSRELREANRRLEELGQIPVRHLEDLRAAFEEECAKVGVEPQFVLATKCSPEYTEVRRSTVGYVCNRFPHLSVSALSRFFGLSRHTILKARKHVGGHNG